MKVALIIGLILICGIGSICFAQGLSARDKYYDGLSRVIEVSIDNPQACLKKVESYINRNKKVIERMLTEPISFKSTGSGEAEITPQARFNRAMAELSAKYPEVGQKIMIANIKALIPPVEDK